MLAVGEFWKMLSKVEPPGIDSEFNCVMVPVPSTLRSYEWTPLPYMIAQSRVVHFIEEAYKNTYYDYFEVFFPSEDKVQLIHTNDPISMNEGAASWWCLKHGFEFSRHDLSIINKNQLVLKVVIEWFNSICVTDSVGV